MESNQLNSPKVFSDKGQGKDTNFQGQMQRVFAAMPSSPMVWILKQKKMNNEKNNLMQKFCFKNKCLDYMRYNYAGLFDEENKN